MAVRDAAAGARENGLHCTCEFYTPPQQRPDNNGLHCTCEFYTHTELLPNPRTPI
jgi:hypothetical protein